MNKKIKFKLKSKHWIVDNQNNIVFAKGRMEILEAIEQTGSINQAAKLLQMSYKSVWSKIKTTEKHLKSKVVHSDKKDGTQLTSAGIALLTKFKQMNKECMAEDDRCFFKIFRD